MLLELGDACVRLLGITCKCLILQAQLAHMILEELKLAAALAVELFELFDARPVAFKLEDELLLSLLLTTLEQVERYSPCALATPVRPAADAP